MLIPIQGNEGRDPVTIDCATQQHTPNMVNRPDVGLMAQMMVQHKPFSAETDFRRQSNFHPLKVVARGSETQL